MFPLSLLVIIIYIRPPSEGTFVIFREQKKNLSVSPACLIWLLEMGELTLPFFCVPGLDIPLAAVGH